MKFWDEIWQYGNDRPNVAPDELSDVFIAFQRGEHRKRADSMAGKRCTICGKSGHTAGNCPMKGK